MTKSLDGIAGAVILILILVICIQLILTFLPYPFSLSAIAVGGPISVFIMKIHLIVKRSSLNV